MTEELSPDTFDRAHPDKGLLSGWGLTERERVYYTLLRVPGEVEGLIWFGWCMSLDAILGVVTLLPLRVMFSIVRTMWVLSTVGTHYVLRRRRRRRRPGHHTGKVKVDEDLDVETKEHGAGSDEEVGATIDVDRDGENPSPLMKQGVGSEGVLRRRRRHKMTTTTTTTNNNNNNTDDTEQVSPSPLVLPGRPPQAHTKMVSFDTTMNIPSRPASIEQEGGAVAKGETTTTTTPPPTTPTTTTTSSPSSPSSTFTATTSSSSSSSSWFCPTGRGSMSWVRADHVSDLCWVMIVVCCAWVISRLDTGWWYHAIRTQDMLKLYAVMNTVEIMDKIFSSFAVDALQSMGLTASKFVTARTSGAACGFVFGCGLGGEGERVG